METTHTSSERIPSWQLYGETQAFPDILHCEQITDRAAGLDWNISPHRHAHLHQFFLIRAGTVEMKVDGVALSPDAPCVISIPHGTVHGFTFSADTDGYVVTIPRQSLPEIFGAHAPALAGLARFAIAPANADLMRKFADLHAEHAAQHPARLTMLKSMATAVACYVLRELPDQVESSGRVDERIQHFRDLVQAHMRDGWKLTRYAEQLGITPRHLGRLCQKHLGQSPTDYLEAALMQEACRLLVYTRDRVAAVGYQLGFDDPSYFSRAFRRHVNETPRAYRARFERE